MLRRSLVRAALFAFMIGCPACFARGVVRADAGAALDGIVAADRVDAPTGEPGDVRVTDSVEARDAAESGDIAVIRADVQPDVLAPMPPPPGYLTCTAISSTRASDGGKLDPQTSCRLDATLRGCGVVAVEGGTFTMGEDLRSPSGPTIHPNSLPLQPAITVSAFRVDAYEVTVGRMRRFLAEYDAGRWSPSRYAYMPDCTHTFEIGSYPVTTERFETGWYELEANNFTASPGPYEDHPANWFHWATALHFCAFEGGRLPTEPEWEWMARGRAVPGLPSPRTFPRGNIAPSNCDEANVGAICYRRGTPPYTRAVDRTDEVGGIFGLGGNVTEYTMGFVQLYHDESANPTRYCWRRQPQVNPLCVGLNYDAPTPREEIIMRGARLDSHSSLLAAAARWLIDWPGVQFWANGFRCVYPER